MIWCVVLFFSVFSQLMECCVNALVTSFKETILAECPGMIKRNETDSEYCCTRPRPPTCRVHESGCAGVFVLCVTDCLLFLLARAALDVFTDGQSSQWDRADAQRPGGSYHQCWTGRHGGCCWDDNDCTCTNTHSVNTHPHVQFIHVVMIKTQPSIYLSYKRGGNKGLKRCFHVE